MNRACRNGLIVALVHLALVGAVGAKFAVDQARYPRVWVRTVPVDPDLPLRGRYVRLNIAVNSASAAKGASPAKRVQLQVRNKTLLAIDGTDGQHWITRLPCGTQTCWVLQRPLAYFIPEHVPDPARRAPGEELWVEVSVPPEGPPRPIRLGVKKDGKVTPLGIR